MNTAEQLATDQAILSQILDELRRQRTSAKDELWDADDIASYLRYRKSTVQNKTLSAPGFPRAVILVNDADSKKGTKRWKAEEVRAWALKIRE